MLTRQDFARFLPLPALRVGLVMGGVWAWVLSFPLFGPLLQHSTGSDAALAGAYYVFSMAMALAVLLWVPRRPGDRGWRALVSACVASAATILFLTVPALEEPGIARVLLLALVALAQADLYLAVIDLFVIQTNHLATLAVAFGTAYAVNALVAAAVELTRSLSVVEVPLIGMVLLSAVRLGQEHRIAAPSPPPSSLTPPRQAWAEALPLAAFALAVYGVGGIWYCPVEIQGLPFWPAIRSLLSALIVLALARYLWRRNTNLLAPLGLGAIGLGLLLAAAPVSDPAGTLLHRLVMTLGMLAADLFYWLYLGRLAADPRRRPIFGLGLIWAWGLIGTENFLTLAFPSMESPPQGFLLTGAAIILAVVPFISSFAQAPPEPEAPKAPVPAMSTEAIAAAEQPAPSPATEASVMPPTELTAAERAVYALLIKGAHDAEIAEALVISPHTVKFHVRNILRKIGAANLTDLLSRLLHQSGRQD
ncbi:MAG: helix-turn-helix transcriptional regulator [Mycobacterium leprae]